MTLNASKLLHCHDRPAPLMQSPLASPPSSAPARSALLLVGLAKFKQAANPEHNHFTEETGIDLVAIRGKDRLVILTAASSDLCTQRTGDRAWSPATHEVFETLGRPSLRRTSRGARGSERACA